MTITTDALIRTKLPYLSQTNTSILPWKIAFISIKKQSKLQHAINNLHSHISHYNSNLKYIFRFKFPQTRQTRVAIAILISKHLFRLGVLFLTMCYRNREILVQFNETVLGHKRQNLAPQNLFSCCC